MVMAMNGSARVAFDCKSQGRVPEADQGVITGLEGEGHLWYS